MQCCRVKVDAPPISHVFGRSGGLPWTISSASDTPAVVYDALPAIVGTSPSAFGPPPTNPYLHVFYKKKNKASGRAQEETQRGILN